MLWALIFFITCRSRTQFHGVAAVLLQCDPFQELSEVHCLQFIALETMLGSVYESVGDQEAQQLVSDGGLHHTAGDGCEGDMSVSQRVTLDPFLEHQSHVCPPPVLWHDPLLNGHVVEECEHGCY